MASFPVLTMIDHRNGQEHDGPRLSARPDAGALERRARALAEAYWSEHVWLTGQVSDAEFRAVYAALTADEAISIEPGEQKHCVSILQPFRDAVLSPAFLARQRVRLRIAS
jgi:hypothetical protein